MAVLGPADVPLLEGCGAVVQRNDEAVVDPGLIKHVANLFGLQINTDATDQPDLGPECPEHRRHAGRATEPVLTAVSPQERYGGLLADPLGVPPDVTVEDQVANDEDAGMPERLDAADQVVGHAAVLLDLEW